MSQYYSKLANGSINIIYPSKYVGIGTTNPGYKLDVAGDARINDSGAANGTASETMRVVNTAAGATSSYVYIGASSGTDWKLGKNVPGTLSRTNFDITTHTGVFGLTVDTYGKVGIGTTTPYTKLQVDNTLGIYSTDTTTGGQIYLGSSDFYNGSYYNSAPGIGAIISTGCSQPNGLGFYTYTGSANSRTEVMRIENNGWVGIGTTDPSQMLHVDGRAVITSDLIVGKDLGATLYAANQSTFNETSIVLDGDDNVVGLRMTALRTTGASTYEIWADSTALHFDTMNSGRDFVFNSQGGSSDYCNQVWIMQPTGNVGIGTTNPISKLHVSSTSSSYLTIQNTTNAGCAGLNLRDESGTDQFKLFYDLGNNASCAHINGNGLTLYSTQVSAEIAKFGLPTNYTAAYFKGCVGIGTTSPGGLLHLQSDGGNACGSYLLLKHANNNNTDIVATIEFANNLGKTACIQSGTTGHCQSGYMSFSTELSGSASEVMRITEDSNVGIGKTNPGSRLSVDGVYGINVRPGTAGACGASTAINNLLSLTMPYGPSSATCSNAGARVGVVMRGSLTDPITGDGQKTAAIYGVSEDVLGYSRKMGMALYTSSFDANAAERVRIDADGNVGIGTTDPGNKLHVEGDIRIASGGILRLITSAGTTRGYIQATDTDSNHLIIATSSGEDIAFKDGGTGGDTNMLICGTGAIKLPQYGSCTFSGTPTMYLTVDSSGNIIEELISSGTPTGSGTTGYVPKWTGSVALGNSIICDNGSGIGINTTTISTEANIGGALSFQPGGSAWDPDNSRPQLKREANGELRISSGKDSASQITFHTNTTNLVSSTEKMRITPGGGVGIGETTPLGKLHVKDGDVVVEQGDLYIASSSGAEGGEDGGGTGKPTLYFGESEGCNVKGWSMGWRYDGDAQSGDCNMLYTVTNAGSSADGHLTVQYGGNIGIGTTTPGCRLDIINGAIRISSSGESKIHFRETVATDTYADRWTIGNDDAVNNGFVISCGANLDTPRLVVLDTGNVGIGSTDPGGILDLRSSTANCMVFGYSGGTGAGHELQWDSSKVYINADPTAGYGNSGIRLSVDNQTIMSLTSNVGIGSVVPAYPFEVCRDTTGLISRIYNTNANGEGVLIRAGDAACKTRAFQVAATDDTKRFTINSDGTVGIGITNPTGLLHVYNGEFTLNSSASYTSHFNYQNTGTHYISMANSGYTYFRGSSNGCNPLTVSGGGKVGVNNTNPGKHLDVVGEVKIDTSADNAPALCVSRNAGVSSVSATGAILTNTAVYINGNENTGSDALRIGSMNNSSGDYFIDASNYDATAAYDIILNPFVGNVGIGITDPTGKLHVAGHICQNNGCLVSDSGSLGYKMAYDGSRSYIVLDNDTADGLGAGSDYLYIAKADTCAQIHNVEGLMHLRTGGHLWLESTDSTALYIQLKNNGNIRGYIHANSGCSVGFLDSGGSWAIRHANDTGTYFSDNNNTTRAFIGAESYFCGNVGIGTTDPTAPLHVVGTNNVEGPTVPSVVQIADSSDVTKNLRLGYESTWDAGSISSSDLGSGWKSTVINARGGNVGIGTTNPTARLDVKSSIIVRDSNSDLTHVHLQSNATEGVLRLRNGSNWGFIARGSGNNPYIGAYSGGSLNIVGFTSADASSFNSALTIFDFANSRVGIGTTSPDSLLHVHSTGTCATFTNIAHFRSGPDENATGSEIFIGHQGNSRGLIIQGGRGGEGTIADDTAVAHFCLNRSGGTIPSTTQDHIMTFRQGGFVGIGTTEPGTNTGKLFVGTPPTTGSAAIAQFGGFIRTNYILTHDSNYGIHPNTTCCGSVGTSAGVYKCAHICKIIAYGGICPSDDGNRPLGGSTYRWSNVHTVCTTTGAIFESNLCTCDIGSCPKGSVVVWRDGKLQGTTQEYDHRVMGITAPDSDSPIVMGAEPILVTGDIEEGDPIVTSSIINHGMKGDRSCDLHGRVIGEALESGSGDSYTIMGMVRKF